MAKPFDPDATLFHVETLIPDVEGPKWVVMYESVDEETAKHLHADLLRRPLCDPQTVRIVPRFYPG